MRKYLFIISALLLLAGCAESDLLHPYGQDDGVPPAKITKVKVRNWSGAATISYKLPSDPDLSYVKATFVGTNGEPREMKASAYVDSMVLEGFGNTKKYKIELRAYDKFENASDPIVVTVSPKKPPIQMVYESLKWETDFGGFAISFENQTKSDIGIYVVSKDEVTKELTYYDVYYTEKASGVYAVRGLPDVENDFGIYVQDHWGNTSKTLTFKTTPLKEDELMKPKFQLLDPARFPGDLPSNQWNETPSNLWDGKIDNWNYGHTSWPIEFPHRFTFDLGVIAKMSRMKTWQRSGEDVRWKHGAWRLFKVYGCTELPPANGADPMAGWTLVGDFTSVKPSGLPQGQESDEDLQLLADGEEFIFDRNAPAVRYLRFEINAVHSEMKLSVMSEIRLWGQIDNEDPDGLGEY